MLKWQPILAIYQAFWIVWVFLKDLWICTELGQQKHLLLNAFKIWVSFLVLQIKLCTEGSCLMQLLVLEKIALAKIQMSQNGQKEPKKSH